MNKNEQIKCDVFSCIHNCDCCCSLDSIKVSCNGKNEYASKKETICDSFKKKD